MRSRDSLCLSDQLTGELRRSGVNFRIMLVGESGLGKTTFTRALLRPYVPDHLLDQPADAVANEPVRPRTVEIHEIVHRVENDGFPVEFTIVDCPGYGDAMDTTPWIEKIVAYVRSRFESHFDELGHPPKATGANNGLARDDLVHVCLYFIAAHRLKGVDVRWPGARPVSLPNPARACSSSSATHRPRSKRARPAPSNRTLAARARPRVRSSNSCGASSPM